MKSTPHYDREQFEQAFERARAIEYPEIDKFEKLVGYAVSRERLEEAARVLQCPIKANAPNWQHGRVLYALARQYIAWQKTPTTFVDIGTAKGFSACVLTWAIADAGAQHRVVSLDIVDPEAFVPRNSIVETETLKTVAQFVEPFVAPGVSVEFHGGGAARWLIKQGRNEHLGFAFVDGKHTFQAVTFEAIELQKHQRKGDVIVFDDAQIGEVHDATMQLRSYRRESLFLSSTRRGYCVAIKC
jgi:predicted O-methyltransferase YrrM